MICKKGFLRNLVKFTGKHLCQSIFFNKVAGLRPATLLKKRPWHRCFPMNFAKFYKTPLGDCFWIDIDPSRTCLETHCCLLCMCSLFANISYHEGSSSVRNTPEKRTGKDTSSDNLYLLKYNFKTKINRKSEIGI